MTAILCVTIVAVLAISNIVLVYLLNKTEQDHRRNLNYAIDKVISEVKYSKPKDGIDGKTPLKNVDYFDGKDGLNGNDGKDSKSTHTKETIIKETPIKGDKGDNGLTPKIQCNTIRNRWEIRYNSNDAWEALNGEIVPCKGVE